MLEAQNTLVSIIHPPVLTCQRALFYVYFQFCFHSPIHLLPCHYCLEPVPITWEHTWGSISVLLFFLFSFIHLIMKDNQLINSITPFLALLICYSRPQRL